MVDLSDADKRAIFGADYKEKASVNDDAADAAYAAQKRRKLAESMSQTGWMTAFVAIAYASGVFFEIFGPYESGMMYWSLGGALAGVVLAIAGGQYGKKA